MPPRRSTARLSATPIRASSPTKRSTRGSSVLASEDAIPRRVTRGGSQQPSMAAEGAVNNPRLPEVQIQQSYAYGSSKSAVLPAQLVARNKMNLREMAETIDAGVEQAQQHLQHHIEETHAQLQNETDPRAERARRRASREPASREGSVTTDDVEKNKSQRVAAWASSLESSQLDEIPEEDSSSGRPPSTPDNATHKDTDPSSFPSGIFDHSYNYERGLRRPNVTVRRKTGGDSTLQQAWKTAKTIADQSRQASARALGATAQWTSRLFRASGRAISDLPNSVFVQVMRYCGGCVRASSSPLNFTLGANGGDLSKLSAALSGIQSQIQAIEGRLSEKLDSQYTIVDTDIKELRRQHSELSSHIAGLQRVRGGGSVSSSGDVASPVIAKVNYFAPNNGANVDPHNTSPTRERRQALVSRVLSRMVGMTLYETKPAITALQPWQDVGDYWCSSASPANNDDQQDSMRLGVRVAEMIFPTEVVVENYPNAGSLFPGSTPKRIQVWADFQHLDSREWESLNIRQMQADGPLSLGPTYALIGEVEYDASVEAPHVQAFPLAVNQHDIHLYAAQSFVVRVVENYGAEYTCLYRIRMHGVPALQYHDGR
ncbi:hypothetical protein HRR78_001498 [Exophiala dermatitidis]|nr:hypothetical protein HRR75_003732 [Exophiala dermatitidis]KAJ4557823.1 hypothetical protein HRR78_001498 [Exophiala dermatitidis]